MRLSKETVEALWAEFADVPVNDLEEVLEPFCGWEVFTDRERIWRWFDEQYARWGGVHALMFPSEHGGPDGEHEFNVHVERVCRIKVASRKDKREVAEEVAEAAYKGRLSLRNGSLLLVEVWDGESGDLMAEKDQWSYEEEA